MAARRITFLIDVDLAKGSKEAHAVTIAKVAEKVGTFAVEAMEAKGYRVRKATASTTLHYVRHVLPLIIKAAPRVRHLKKVG